MGCQVMQRVFNADDIHQTPFFAAYLYPEAWLAFHTCHGESHVPGRHLNALLNAEDVLGLKLDESAVERLAATAYYSYSGAIPLPLNREEINGPLVNFAPHNLREGMHALVALVQFRDSEAARVLAEKSIAAVLDLWSPDGSWDVARLRALGLNYQDNQDFVQGEGRMIGPLVKYYRLTQSAAALDLSLKMKEVAVGRYFLPDGRFDREHFPSKHVHSITSVMSSLAQMAVVLDDSELMMRVKAFYDNGLWHMRDEIGWSPETLYRPEAEHGEANNTGDILETALILGRQGHAEYFHDAERILRCHLLPSQLRDISFAPEQANPQGLDGLHNVAQRLQGAFGFPAPYGHFPAPDARDGRICFNLDIVGGAVASLCEAWREAAKYDGSSHRVNLLFDHETEAIIVRSPYTHDALSVTLKKPGALHLRIPPWVEPEALKLEGAEAKRVNGYLVFDQVAVGQEVTVRFPLSPSEIVLSRALHPEEIRVSLSGDAVSAMDGRGMPLAFFPPHP